MSQFKNLIHRSESEIKGLDALYVFLLRILDVFYLLKYELMFNYIIKCLEHFKCLKKQLFLFLTFFNLSKIQ